MILRSTGALPLAGDTNPRSTPPGGYTASSGSYPVRTIRRLAGVAPLAAAIPPILYAKWRGAPLAVDIQSIW